LLKYLRDCKKMCNFAPVQRNEGLEKASHSYFNTKKVYD